MERYIGLIKEMVGLMSNIDIDIANKAVVLEHLNHLPPPRQLHVLRQPLGWNAKYPQPPEDVRMKYTKDIKHTKTGNLTVESIRARETTSRWVNLLQHFFRDTATREELVLWKKYHIRHKCFVGSKESQNNLALNRRDDSFVWWEEGGSRRYGQVVIFATLSDWEPVAIVRPFKKVEEVRQFGTTRIVEDLGKMEVITVNCIQGLVGRNTKC